MTEAQPILTIYNRLSISAGEPPHLTNADGGRYVGYFQNEHGDQWLFIDDPVAGTATLRCGDMHWSRAHTMHGPNDLPTMNECERSWARQCWEAAAFSREARSRTARL